MIAPSFICPPRSPVAFTAGPHTTPGIRSGSFIRATARTSPGALSRRERLLSLPTRDGSRTLYAPVGLARQAGAPPFRGNTPQCATNCGPAVEVSRAAFSQMPHRLLTVATAGGVAVRKADAAGMLPGQPAGRSAAIVSSAGSIGTPATNFSARHGQIHAHHIAQSGGRHHG